MTTTSLQSQSPYSNAEAIDFGEFWAVSCDTCRVRYGKTTKERATLGVEQHVHYIEYTLEEKREHFLEVSLWELPSVAQSG